MVLYFVIYLSDSEKHRVAGFCEDGTERKCLRFWVENYILVNATRVDFLIGTNHKVEE
jgi:hypothetical protein